MNIELFIILIFYSIGSLALSYYLDKFISDSQDSIDPIPPIWAMLKKISSNYSMVTLILLWFFSAFIAMIILFIFTNWLINSALIPLIIFFSGPRVAMYFEETRVTISEGYSNIFETLYARYHRYIISGFLSGFATKLIDNWINIGAISFLWFLINFLIISFLIALILRDELFD